jgi:predicted pyridoxine 5'-phosphate oxidase superfamily flavin-nucleotide-binding protein
MGILTADMQRVVLEQRLGYVATVCPDGTPNLSPKGTTTVWDDDHLVFANIRSPGTLANLRINPAVEVNVVDPLLRKGYRFKGVATIASDGPLFDRGVALFRARGVANRITEIVLITVERALKIDSPAYDTGLSEGEVRAQWEDYWRTLWASHRSD